MNPGGGIAILLAVSYLASPRRRVAGRRRETTTIEFHETRPSANLLRKLERGGGGGEGSGTCGHLTQVKPRGNNKDRAIAPDGGKVIYTVKMEWLYKERLDKLQSDMPRPSSGSYRSRCGEIKDGFCTDNAS